MFSTDEDRLTELTQAIDDLAATGMTGLPPAQLAERVARVWALVEGLDPELTHRRNAYTDSRLATCQRNVGNFS